MSFKMLYLTNLTYCTLAIIGSWCLLRPNILQNIKYQNEKDALSWAANLTHLHEEPCLKGGISINITFHLYKYYFEVYTIYVPIPYSILRIYVFVGNYIQVKMYTYIYVFPSASDVEEITSWYGGISSNPK